MPWEYWQPFVLILSVLCHTLILWRLWTEGLLRVYLYFALFLANEAIATIVLLPVNPKSLLYVHIFLVVTPISWILSYLVVLELYRLTLEDYPGIATVGRRAVSWLLGLAVLASIIYAIPDLIANDAKSPVLRVYVILERSVVLGILVFLVLIQLFLLRYRLRLSPNRIVYATGYALYFAVTMAQDVIVTSLGLRYMVYTYTLLMNVGASLLLLTGAILLSQKGEVKPKLEVVDSSADRARLQQQLTDINRMLTRAARGQG
jgi:hypothetical protein